MRLFFCCAVLVTLAACASRPLDQRREAFDAYWKCTFDQARSFVDQRGVSAHAVAMRAQARCNESYDRYRRVNADYLRSVVAPEGREMATRIADRSALQKRRAQTRRVAAWVTKSRR